MEHSISWQQSDKPQSQRRHVENLLWKLFRNITDRPTYFVHCKLYNQKRKHEVQGILSLV